MEPDLFQIIQELISRAMGGNKQKRTAAGIAPPGPTAPAPMKPPAPPTDLMYRQHGLDPSRLKFMKHLSNFMGGLNYQRDAAKDAIEGRTESFGDSDVLGGTSGIGTPGSYA